MNTFSLLSLLTILFLFCGHLSSAEKKLPGKREGVQCNKTMLGKCDNFCELWDKPAEQNYCVLENFEPEPEPERVATCYCIKKQAQEQNVPPYCPNWESIYGCLLDGCRRGGGGGGSSREGRHSGSDRGCSGAEPPARVTEENKRVVERTVAECPVDDGERCVELCGSWGWADQSNSFCVVESVKDIENEIELKDYVASCYCRQIHDASLPDREEVFSCLRGECRGDGDEGRQ